MPDEVVSRVSAAGFKAVPTGIEHGTVTVVIDKHPFEVTTLRQDVETYGRHAKVAFGRDWKADAERRDFTINALSATRDGAVYDYVGGLADLAARRVRFIGDREQAHRGRLSAHPALLPFPRRLRHRRPSRRRGLAACIAGRDGLDQLVARTRAHGDDEAAGGAACGADADRHDRCRAAAARARRRALISASFENMAKVEAAIGLPADPVRRLGALGVMVAEDAERLWQKLRLTNAEHERLASMAEGWRRISPALASRPRARCSTGSGRSSSPITRCSAGRARRRARTTRPGMRWRALPQRWSAPVFPLKAADFIARGVEKGPALGAALAAAEKAWIAAGFPHDKAALDAIADSAARQ